MGFEDHLDSIKGRLKEVTKGATIIFIGLALGRISAFATRLLLARFVGAEGYGLFSLAIAIFNIITVFSMIGFPIGIARFIAFYRAKEDIGKVSGTIFSSLKMTLPIGVTLTLLIIIFSQKISVLLFHEPKLSPILKVFALAIPFYMIAVVFISALRGFKAIKEKVLAEDIFGQITKLSFVLCFLFLGFGVKGAGYAYIIGSGVTLIVAFHYLNKTFPAFLRKSTKNESMMIALLTYSWPLFFADLINQIRVQIGTLLLGYFVTSSEVGIFNAAFPISQLLLLFLLSLNYIFMPTLTELLATHKMRDINRMYKIVAKWSFYLTFPCFLVIITFSKQILGVLFGSAYIDASLPLQILSLGFLTVVIVGSTGTLMVAAAKTKAYLIFELVGITNNIIFNLLFIPRWGITGAAMAVSISLIIMHTMSLMYVYYCFKMQPFTLNHLQFGFAALIWTTIFYLIDKFTPLVLSGWLVIIIVLPILFTLSWLSQLLEKGLDEDDLLIIKAVGDKIGIRMGFIDRFLICQVNDKERGN